MANRNVHLHARDVAVMQLLLDRRAETAAYLHERFWPGRQRQSSQKRLRALERAGYVARTDDVTVDEPARYSPIYVLGPRARAALLRRSAATEDLRRRRAPLAPRRAAVPHQVALNRVGDRLATFLVPEHRLPLPPGGRRHRADGAYQVRPDAAGRHLVLLEIDLGHYSRARLLGKVAAFRSHPDARACVIVVFSNERAALVERWLAVEGGRDVHVLTFDRLQGPGDLPHELRPLGTASR